jgi:hypothetical protein
LLFTGVGVGSKGGGLPDLAEAVGGAVAFAWIAVVGRRERFARGANAHLSAKCARRWGTRICAGLFRFVCFEESSCLFQVESGSVHGQLIYTGVFRDGDDVLNTMAPVS